MTEASTETTAAETQTQGQPPAGEKAPEKPSETDGKDWKAEAEKWKSLSRKNEDTAKANAAAAKRLEEIEAANASELDKAVAKARDEGRAEVQSAANARLISAEARALAAEVKFRNPTLAVKAIDLSGVSVSDDGTVDVAAIRSALSDLAKADPYLVDDGKTPRPKPDDAQGRPPATPVANVTPGMGRLREAYAEKTPPKH